MKRPKIEDDVQYYDEEYHVYAEALEKYADWLWTLRMDELQQFIEVRDEQEKEITELKHKEGLSRNMFREKLDDIITLKKQIKELKHIVSQLPSDLVHELKKPIKGMNTAAIFKP